MPLLIRTTGLEQYAPGGDARVKALIVGGPGVGKALATTTRVATPHGWQEIGDLAPGDQVIGSSGKPVTVTGVYPQGRRPVYGVLTNDGTYIHADADHLWTVWPRKRREDGGDPITLTTAEMIERGVRSEREGHKPRYGFFLPIAEPAQYEHASLPIGPYLLGTLLANGSLTSDVVTFTTNDETVANGCIAENPELDIRESTVATSTSRRWRIRQLHPLLRLLGIDHLLSADKHIPDPYLTADESARRALLAGLMDGDGSATPGRRASYHSTSSQLAEDVRELVLSLGGVARVDHHRRDDQADMYEVRIWLPTVPFHSEKSPHYSPIPWFRAIESIEPLSMHKEMVCIKVDAPDELFVIEGYVVTHNTRFASYFPRPIYADCEGGLASVADRNVPYVTVRNSTDMLDLLAHLKQECRQPRESRTYDTVVVDTFDAYQRVLKNEWMEKERKEAFQGWEAWGYVAQRMQLLLTRLLNLDMNVVVNCHYKDKTTRDDDTGKESHQLQLQVQGEVGETAFNDFDLVGWMGAYFEAVGGERVQKRGLTFQATPERPWLKDRLNATPKWMEVTFAVSDYESLFERVSDRLAQLKPGETVGEIPSADPEATIPASVVAPEAARSGPLPTQTRVELPLAQLDKPALQKKARDLGVTTLADGTPMRGNVLKAELIAAIEAANAPSVPTVPTVPSVPTVPTVPSVPSVPVANPARVKDIPGEGLVDTTTGEVLSQPPAEPQAPVAPPTPVPPTQEQAVANVEDVLGGTVVESTPSPSPPQPAQQAGEALVPAEPRARVATPPPSGGPVCEECGKELAGENQDYVKLAFIKYRKRLCEEHYVARKRG